MLVRGRRQNSYVGILTVVTVSKLFKYFENTRLRVKLVAKRLWRMLTGCIRSILIDRLLCLCRIFPNVDDSDLAELGADSVRELVDKSAHALVSDCHGQSTATKIYVSVHIYSWHSYPWLRLCDVLNIDLSH